MNHSIHISGAPPQCIALPSCKGLLLIYRIQIIRIQSISNYSKLFLSNGTCIVASKTLHWFEGNPALAGFLRIHRTHLVNPDYIKRYDIESSGFLFLSTGEILKIARRKKATIVQRLLKSDSNDARKYVSCPFHLQQSKHRVA